MVVGAHAAAVGSSRGRRTSQLLSATVATAEVFRRYRRRSLPPVPIVPGQPAAIVHIGLADRVGRCQRAGLCSRALFPQQG
jgi:hypothetical protein